MKKVRSLLLALPLAGLALAAVPGDASACGGCVVPPGEDTQVTGHRMIFSLAMAQTTLYDQIEYSGAPESFAWFLPIHGTVDVGLSSDALFAFLGSDTSVQVIPPPVDCPAPPEGCYWGEEDAGFGTGGGGGASPNAGGVDVLVQETVGPYETVQLAANDPNALLDWFAQHGYQVPDDVKPVISAYQQEGFGFLAMKLVPGQGVQSMRPVRITTEGAGLSLPLRMVAAGTGAVTPITLFVMAEGRYEASNFPNLGIDSEKIIWHWDTYSSNYDTLLDIAFKGSNGFGWVTQSATPYYKSDLESRINQVIDFNPGQTGWGDPDNGISEYDDAAADLNTLFAGMDPNSIWLARMHARLSRPALGNDLKLGAEATQSEVSRYIQSKIYDGQPPACPDYSWCYDDGSNGGNFNGVGQSKDDYVTTKGSCAVQKTGSSDPTAFLLVGLGLAGAAVSMRRRRR